MTLLSPSHSLETCGSPEVIASTTILRNVVEKQLGKAGTPHHESQNWAPLHKKYLHGSSICNPHTFFTHYENVFQGCVVFSCDGKSYYDGELVDNIRHGWGVRQYPSGNIYKGMWFNNVRHGYGTMKWVDCSQLYTGQWESGVQVKVFVPIWFFSQFSYCVECCITGFWYLYFFSSIEVSLF